MRILEAKGVSKRYGGFLALDEIDLSIERGEIRALLGPNGSGKSTLIDVLSGRAKNFAGQVRLNGEDITRLTPSERRMKGLSRSFQTTSIFSGLTVQSQLELAAHKAEKGSDIHETLSEFGLKKVAQQLARDLSYGDQRRLDLALALCGQPQVLLLDEPAAGLSFEESLKLADTLRELATRRNVTIILVEHDMELVFKVADSITVLQTGKVLAEGKPHDVRSNPEVIRAYLGSAA